MQLFATDFEKLEFLLEAEADLALELGTLAAFGAELVTEEVPEGKRPKYITNYIGSKQKLVDWIWKHTSEDAESVADAFCGSSVVGYMYKTKGLSVTANDRLRYSFHGARAIIENQKSRLAQEDLDALLADNPKAGTFVRDHFKGIFFADGVHGLIDQIRANIDKLPGYKKDIALFALGKTCISAKGGFGHFTSVIDGGKHLDTPEEFKERFSGNVARINALVFDSGKQCQASNQDVNEFLAGAKVDLAYFDPPYATEFSTTNYEKAYHFIEGLMSYWQGLTINEGSKVKFYETDHQTVTKANAKGFFETFLGSAKHIPNWLISYRDHAYPNEDEMKGIIAAHGRESSMESKDHHYSISAKRGDASNAQERLFICKAGKKPEQSAKPAAKSEPKSANFHISIPVEVVLRPGAAPLTTEAQDLPPGLEDPKFTFILCRAGTNKNGDHFTPEELASRYMTAVNKKVDLKHSQDFTDIVGGIVASDYLADDSGGRVECIGELYVGDSQHAQLAYKLMKRGIITQVSMECDYEEGECSICGKRVKNKNEYCPHLAKFKGGVLDGKPVFEILHGVTFTGLGLLDRKGADENARITQVAAVTNQNHFNHSEGGSAMDDKTKDSGAGEAAKKKPEGGGGGFPPADSPGGDKGGGDKPTQQELEKENKTLKQKVLELQKRIDELEAEQKAAANKARAHKLVNRLEKQGIVFGDEDERENEMKRLAGLSDDAFAATEAAYERMVKSRKAEVEKPETAPAEQPEKKESKASSETPLRSDAGVRPREVDDRKSSLEDQLREGFMAAYKSRVAQNKGDLAAG